MTSPRPVSPGIVFVAGLLLAGVATAQVVTAVGNFYAIPYARFFYSEQAGDERAGQVAVIGLVMLGLVALVTAVIYSILTPLASRGIQAARVLTWVVVGLTVIGCAVGLVLAPYSGLGWYRWLTLTTTVASVVFAVTAAVLLGLPKAGPYFRRVRRTVSPLPAPYPGPFIHRPPTPPPYSPHGYPPQPPSAPPPSAPPTGSLPPANGRPESG